MKICTLHLKWWWASNNMVGVVDLLLISCSSLQCCMMLPLCNNRITVKVSMTHISHNNPLRLWNLKWATPTLTQTTPSNQPLPNNLPSTRAWVPLTKMRRNDRRTRSKSCKTCWSSRWRSKSDARKTRCARSERRKRGRRSECSGRGRNSKRSSRMKRCKRRRKYRSFNRQMLI